MVLTAPAANNFTIIATNTQNASDLQREVDLSERAIRNAATRQQYHTLFDARIIGNPSGDPLNDALLTQPQIDYRDAFINAGYLVTLDANTGYWRLSWEDQGVEELVSIYSIRTTVAPGPISAQTITLIEGYFASQVPVSKAKVTLVNDGNGADTDETDFGATVSIFYEYVAVVQQQDPVADMSAGLRVALIGSPLGYIDVPSNVAVYKLA